MDQSALKVSPDFHTQRAVWPQLVVFGPENFNHRPALLFFQLRQQALARAGGGQRGQLLFLGLEALGTDAEFDGDGGGGLIGVSPRLHGRAYEGFAVSFARRFSVVHAVPR
jgi:hypothetical protein